MIKMYKTEGLPAFWKGILPPILVETPKRAVKVSVHCLTYKRAQKEVSFIFIYKKFSFLLVFYI